MAQELFTARLQAYTRTTAPYVQPAEGANVTVQVDATGFLPVGMPVFIEGGGPYAVAQIVDSEHVVLTSIGDPVNAAPGAIVPTNRRLCPGGITNGDRLSHGGQQMSDGIHTTLWKAFTNATTRRAQALTAADVGKRGLQLDTAKMWDVVPSLASPGTYTWGDSNGPENSFTGDFGALFASYSGLNVRAYFRSDLGVSGTTGTGKSAWANQLGDFGNMVPATGATNGIAGVGAGLNGKASLLTNANAAGVATQAGSYTSPSAVAPATTNNHIYAIERYLVTAGSSSFGFMHDSANNNSIFMQAGQTSPAANIALYTGSPGPVATGVVLNQWYRMRASRIGGNDVLRIGAHAPAPVATSNTAPGLTWKFGCSTSDIAGGSCGAIETLLLMHIEGPLATFLTACADADAKAQAFWSSAIEI